MKNNFIVALVLASAAAALTPTIVLAKKGDLYSLWAGGCLKGDVKGSHGWCIEHAMANPAARPQAAGPEGPDAPFGESSRRQTMKRLAESCATVGGTVKDNGSAVTCDLGANPASKRAATAK
jgi:hypothetical protein